VFTEQIKVLYLGEVVAGRRLLGGPRASSDVTMDTATEGIYGRSVGTGTPDPGGWAGDSEIDIRVRFLSAGATWQMLHDEAFGQ
jgi:hypothetical protein